VAEGRALRWFLSGKEARPNGKTGRDTVRAFSKRRSGADGTLALRARSGSARCDRPARDNALKSRTCDFIRGADAGCERKVRRITGGTSTIIKSHAIVFLRRDIWPTIASVAAKEKRGARGAGTNGWRADPSVLDDLSSEGHPRRRGRSPGCGTPGLRHLLAPPALPLLLV
jgi:hypothetical protein